MSRRLLQVLTEWLASTHPAELEALARRRACMVAHLRRRYGTFGVAVARGYLTDAERRWLASLRKADCDRILEHLWAHCPPQAQVLARHPAWYREQLQRVGQELSGIR